MVSYDASYSDDDRATEDYPRTCENCGYPCRKAFCCKDCYEIGKSDNDRDKGK